MADFTANFLNPALLALFTCNWGPASPTNGPGAAPGLFECWANTTTNPVVFNFWDGANWVPFGSLNTSTHVWNQSDTDLLCLQVLATNGMLARTGSGTCATRTITGTANEITVTNGDGVSGNPTLSLPASLTFTGKTITGGTYVNPAISGTTPTGAGVMGFGTSQLNFGDGTTNRFIASLDQTQTLTNKTFSCAANTCTVRLNTADVTGAAAIGNGGTGQTTRAAAISALNPTPTRAGDVLYWDGSNWVTLAGNNSGTQVLQENASGVPSWATVSGTGTVTSVATSGCATGGTFTTSGTVADTPATNSEIWSATANKCVDAAGLNSAGAPVTITDAATIALDLATFVDGSVTLAGNRTLGNPTNTQNGRTGCIYIIQDGTGSRTLAYASNWKFPGGTAPTLTTTAAAVDVLCYKVRTSTFIWSPGLNKDVK